LLDPKRNTFLQKRKEGLRMKGRLFPRKGEIIGICIVLCLVLTGTGKAQGKYPSREINVINGAGVGTSVDLIGRALCNAASKILGQPMIIMNKPGAGTALALGSLKNSKPDGYDLGLLLSGALYGQHLREVPYDLNKDFTYVIQCLEFQQGVLVKSDSRWKTLNELVEYAKANPGKIRVSIPQIGMVQHLVMERLSMKSGAKWIYIPYDGDTSAITAALGGHVEVLCASSTWVPNVNAGQLRLLAVCGGGEKRMPRYPNIPTITELGYEITAPTFYSIGGPKGLPNQVVDTLHKAFKKAMEDPDFIKLVEKFDYRIVYRGPEEFTRYLAEINENVGGLVRKLGLRKE
jgi:tripartite-type tricarboxylate transporter receptor subunit TctC